MCVLEDTRAAPNTHKRWQILHRFYKERLSDFLDFLRRLPFCKWNCRSLFIPPLPFLFVIINFISKFTHFILWCCMGTIKRRFIWLFCWSGAMLARSHFQQKVQMQQPLEHVNSIKGIEKVWKLTRLITLFSYRSIQICCWKSFIVAEEPLGNALL